MRTRGLRNIVKKTMEGFLLNNGDDSDDDFWQVMDRYLAVEQRRIPRLVGNRPNPLENFNDFEFRDRFRLSKDSFITLCHVIEDNVRRNSTRIRALSPETQLAIALRFYATSSFQV